MSNPHPGLDKPLQQTPPSVGSLLLPLAPPLSTPQQVSTTLTRLANTSQGGRITVRSSPNTTISDSPMMASLLSSTEGKEEETTSSTSTRKRQYPLDESNSLYLEVKDKVHRTNKGFRKAFAERSALACYLTGSFHLSEYSPWRSRLPIVPLQNYLKNSKLDSENEAEEILKVLQTQNHSLLQSALTGNKNGQQGANLDVSKTSPASPDKSESLPYKVQKSPLKVTTPTKNNAIPENTISSQEQIVERAKQEAYVMQRIGELQKDGLWAEKRLPKVHELPRTKAHWDYLLEEMAWLAADFAQERKWKKAAAKKELHPELDTFQASDGRFSKFEKRHNIQHLTVCYWGKVSSDFSAVVKQKFQIISQENS